MARCTTCSTGVTSFGCAPSSRRSGMGSDSTHWRTGTCGDDVLDQVRRSLRHAPRAARGTKPPALAAKCHQLVVAAVAAVQAQEAVRQDAALEECIELVFDEGRQARTCGGLHVGEEGLGVLLHQAVQRGLLGPVALVVDQGTIRRPMARTGLPTDGLHALLTRYCCFVQYQTSHRAAIALCGA